MSGIGEFMYTLLLGWVRTLADWAWAMVSGTGNTGAWQWFLSNWKIWLLVLLVGGLVVDCLMWAIRWRPHWLLFSRFRRMPAEGPDESWDEDTGYYQPEIPEDDDGPWADTSFATLAEIDPNWERGMQMPAEGAYDDEYGADFSAYESPVAERDNPYADPAYWDDEELETPRVQPFVAPHAWESPLPTQEDVSGDTIRHDMRGYTPSPPAWEVPEEQPDPIAVFEANNVTPQRDAAPEGNTGPLQYGRPGLWPGAQFPVVAGEQGAQTAQPEPEPLEEPFDPLFNPEGRPEENTAPLRRRRRRLREDAAEQAEEMVAPPAPEAAPPEPARPERVVMPEEVPGALPKLQKGKEDELRTVTGKPVKPKGLRRFALLDEDPIAGLPPMELTDPFLPAARPDDPDFYDDDGEEYP